MPAPGSAQVGGAGEARAELLEEPWKAEIIRAPISMKPVIITPPASPGPGAVIGSLQLSRVRSGHYMDRQTQGAAGDGWGTGGRGRFSLSQAAGHTQNRTVGHSPRRRRCHCPCHRQLRGRSIPLELLPIFCFLFFGFFCCIFPPKLICRMLSLS